MTQAREICVALGGHWHGGYGTALCPSHENTRTPALSLSDGASGKLLVKCHAGCEGADVLTALRARGLLEGHSDWKPDPGERKRLRAVEDAEQRRRINQARRCWAEAGPISGTLAERYLRNRAITCDLPLTLRYHPNCWHGPTARKVPAMVAAVVIDHELVGIHRTYLAEPGEKAFGKESKLMLGRCAGGAVRLSDGLGELLVCEGIETGLSLVSDIADANPRVWAALSTSGVSGLILPRETGELVLAPDGDAAGRKAANKLADRAHASWWQVSTMECPDGFDWNDLAQAAAG